MVHVITKMEDIKWPARVDKKFLFECQQYLSRVSAANECEIPSVDRIRIPKRPCNVLFIVDTDEMFRLKTTYFTYFRNGKKVVINL